MLSSGAGKPTADGTHAQRRLPLWLDPLVRPSPHAGVAMSDLTSYRDQLVQAYMEESKAFDKAVMTLSGGTLGLSLTFIKDVVREPRPGTITLLALAWTALGFSIVAILISMLTSQGALRKAIQQVDEGQRKDLQVQPGGWRSWLTSGLNVGAGMGFVLGVVFLAWFAIANMATLVSSTKP